MARLTASIRNAIINNAVANKQFKEREEAIFAERAQLAEDVRDASLKSAGLTDEKVEEQIKSALRLRKSLRDVCDVNVYSAKCSHIRVNLAGQQRRFDFNGDVYNIFGIFGTPDAVLKIGKDDVSLDREYCEQLDEINNRHKKLREEHEVLIATLTATLKKFTTVEKLVASWPEAEQLLPAAEVVVTGTDVALSVDTLNAICGLPK